MNDYGYLKHGVYEVAYGRERIGNFSGLDEANQAHTNYFIAKVKRLAEKFKDALDPTVYLQLSTFRGF